MTLNAIIWDMPMQTWKNKMWPLLSYSEIYGYIIKYPQEIPINHSINKHQDIRHVVCHMQEKSVGNESKCSFLYSNRHAWIFFSLHFSTLTQWKKVPFSWLNFCLTHLVQVETFNPGQCKDLFFLKKLTEEKRKLPKELWTSFFISCKIISIDR